MKKVTGSRAADCLVQKYIGSAYDNVKEVVEAIDDVIVVAEGMPEVKTVVNNISEITKVAKEVTEVIIVGSNIEEVKTVAGNITEVKEVAENIDGILNAADHSPYKGEWYSGAPVEIGDIWGYQDSEWRSLTGADTTPIEGSDWRLLENKPLNAIVERSSLAGNVYEGKRIEWLGYNTPSDGGSNWGIVKFGAHVEDGGSIFSIDANTYIEANLKGKSISVAKFGYDFNAALAYLISLPNSKVLYSQMKQRDYILTMPTDTYEFDTGLIKRVASPTNPLSITIKGNGSTIKASGSYDGTRWLDLEHVIYFDMQDIKFEGFHTDWVIAINADQFINADWVRTPFKNVTFIDCEYGINYAIESSNLTFDKVYFLGPKTIKAISINRTDQITINRCRFDWWQNSRADWDTLIDLNPDIFETPSTPDTPGLGRYNVSRINVKNSIFIPIGQPTNQPHTGWFGHYGGLLTIDGCHFGPEANIRPSVVINYSRGATFDGDITNQIESGIVIKNSSCVDGFDVVYCKTHYPNVVHFENIRWNVRNYSAAGLPKAHLLGGDHTVLNALTQGNFLRSTRYFNFKFNSANSVWNGLSPFDRKLHFPKLVAEYSPVHIGYHSKTNGGQQLDFYLHDSLIVPFGVVDEMLPLIPDVGMYRVEFRGDFALYSTSIIDTSIFTEHTLLIEREGEELKLAVKTLDNAANPDRGVSMSALFYLNGNAFGASINTTTYPLETSNITILLTYKSNSPSRLWYEGTSNIKVTRMN